MFNEAQLDQIKRLVEEAVANHGRNIVHQGDIVPRTIKPRHIETVYGNMYITNATVTVSVGSADVAYELTSGFTEDKVDGVFMGSTGGYLQTNYGGNFLIIWSMSWDTSTPGDNIEGGVMINGVKSEIGTSHATIITGGANAAASSSIVTLVEGDKVSLYVRNEDNADDVVVEHASVTIIRIGR